MSTVPDDIRSEVAALLADLPDPAADTADDDMDTIAARLEQAHTLLVRALAAVEKG